MLSWILAQSGGSVSGHPSASAASCVMEWSLLGTYSPVSANGALRYGGHHTIMIPDPNAFVLHVDRRLVCAFVRYGRNGKSVAAYRSHHLEAVLISFGFRSTTVHSAHHVMYPRPDGKKLNAIGRTGTD